MKTRGYILFMIAFAMLSFIVGCTKTSEGKDAKIDEHKTDQELTHDHVDDDIPGVKSSINEFMPEKWKVIRSTVIPTKKLDFYSRSYGGQISSMENNYVSSSEPYNYYKFEINVIKAVNKAESKKIFDVIMGRTSHKDKYLIKNDVIYEFSANEAYTARCREIFSK